MVKVAIFARFGRVDSDCLQEKGGPFQQGWQTIVVFEERRLYCRDVARVLLVIMAKIEMGSELSEWNERVE
jgi:hypothetical protein